MFLRALSVADPDARSASSLSSDCRGQCGRLAPPQPRLRRRGDLRRFSQYDERLGCGLRRPELCASPRESSSGKRLTGVGGAARPLPGARA
jgi:hypothetical protein